MVEDEYTEYGYRGLEELKKAQERIKELEKEIEHLKELNFSFPVKVLQLSLNSTC